jgi:glycosyltransferase involved in cell wall biosynthesis
MLNEAEHIERFVEDLACQDFGGEIELVVADGGSTDGSVDALLTATSRHGIATRLLFNEAQWVSAGLNACVRIATGDLLVRLDCHSAYPSDYLRLCAEAATETGAHVVGGIIIAEGRTRVERAVAGAMDSAFGGIGFYRATRRSGNPFMDFVAALGFSDANRRESQARIETDTVTFGAFRREAFAIAGLFDESLRRNQDADFNLRVRKAGGRVVLDPRIRVFYTPRGSITSVFRQYHEYGYWRAVVMVKHAELPSLRTLTPVVFVSSLALLGSAARRFKFARRLLQIELGLYAGLAGREAVLTLRARGESIRLVPIVLATFPAFHLGSGTGMLHGLVRVAAKSAGLRTCGRPKV